MKTPRVVLWDVMGTLVTEPFKEAMPRFLGLEFEEMLRRKDPHSWVEFEHGRIDEDEYVRRFFKDGAEVDKEGLKSAMRRHYALLPGMEPILRSLSGQGVRMHALSNYSDWWRMIEEQTELSRFIGWEFVSCRTGLRKPDPEAYLGAARTLKETPQACLFIDDRQVNVDAARAVGMQAILRTEDAAVLRGELARLGLPLGLVP